MNRQNLEPARTKSLPHAYPAPARAPARGQCVTVTAQAVQNILRFQLLCAACRRIANMSARNLIKYTRCGPVTEAEQRNAADEIEQTKSHGKNENK